MLIEYGITGAKRPVAQNVKEVAARTASGAPLTRSGQVFLDPTDTGAREYALELAAEKLKAVDASSLAVVLSAQHSTEDNLALLPSAVRKRRKPVDDEF